MQSEAVFFDGLAFTHGKKGTDTADTVDTAEPVRTLRPAMDFFQGNWKRAG